MKRLFLMLAALSYSAIGDAQTKSDEDAVRALPRRSVKHGQSTTVINSQP